ncbi:hypothetical protein Cgig2_010389 [Carnegiea gigantea]|uniref:Reverse transcriptase zinc-binding domain-containing protein n=1 Tax=Carnegiea gigantea TaxID=171969 RepID=A0A9Q1K825_9CARY|nr:hypothetical protein Cgig2_010389 [Carnegiea gigantea]
MEMGVVRESAPYRYTETNDLLGKGALRRIIWRVPVTQHVRFFIWLIAHDHIMHNLNRFTQGMALDPLYRECPVWLAWFGINLYPRHGKLLFLHSVSKTSSKIVLTLLALGDEIGPLCLQPPPRGYGTGIPRVALKVLIRDLHIHRGLYLIGVIRLSKL